LFNEHAFLQLEELKPIYFNETDQDKKALLKKQINQLIQHLTNGKEVFDFEIYFSEVFHRKSGFDVVLANPPYVGHKGGQKALFTEIKQNLLGARFNNERMDLFYYFIHLAIDRVRKGGVIAFITTNYYVTADSAIKLRIDIRDRTLALMLMNFNELKIFESALGQHNMISILQKGQDKERVCRVGVTRRTGYASPEMLRNILLEADSETSYRDMPQRSLYEGNMCYISSVNIGAKNAGSIERVLRKLSDEKTRLGEVCGIDQGIVTGLNKISDKHLKRLPKANLLIGQGCFVLTEEERRQMTVDHDPILKPWFKNSDIKRYICSHSVTEWLIHATTELDRGSHKKIFAHLLNV
jgi:adenine-specific DNA-methyltransferase